MLFSDESIGCVLKVVLKQLVVKKNTAFVMLNGKIFWSVF